MNWILWVPQSTWLVLGDIGLFVAASILVPQLITLIILCSAPEEHDAPYVPKKRRPPRNLQHLIQPLIPVGNWIWRQMDMFVQGLSVTRKRRQLPASQRINCSKSRRQRAMMNDVIMCTTQLQGSRASQAGKPTSLNTMPQA